MEPNEPTSITLDILKKIHEGMGDLHRKIDEGLAGVRQELGGVRRDLHRKIDEGIAGVREELGGVRQELGGVRQELGGVRQEMSELREEVRGNNRRIEAQGRRIAGVEGRMHELVQVTTLSITRQLDLGLRVDSIEKRVEALEAR